MIPFMTQNIYESGVEWVKGASAQRPLRDTASPHSLMWVHDARLHIEKATVWPKHKNSRLATRKTRRGEREYRDSGGAEAATP